MLRQNSPLGLLLLKMAMAGFFCPLWPVFWGNLGLAGGKPPLPTHPVGKGFYVCGEAREHKPCIAQFRKGHLSALDEGLGARRLTGGITGDASRAQTTWAEAIGRGVERARFWHPSIMQ